MRKSRQVLMSSVVSVILVSASPLYAQTDGTCVPVSERAGREFGCFITAREELGALAAQPPLYLAPRHVPHDSRCTRRERPARHRRRIPRTHLAVHHRRGRVSGGGRRARCAHRPAPARPCRTLRRCLHGGRVSTGHVDGDSSTSRDGGVVHARRLDVSGNAQRTARPAGWRPRRPGPRWSADDPHWHRDRPASIGRPHPAGYDVAACDARARLDTSRPLSSRSVTNLVS